MTTRLIHSRRGGFSLIELSTVMILLSIFSLFAGKLLVGTFQVIGDSRRAMRDIAEFDHAVRLMRADVWAASKIDVDDPGRFELELELPDAVRVLWVKHVTVTDDKPTAELIRTEFGQDGSTSSHRLTAPVGLGFVADTYGLRLTTDTDTIVLTGTRLLLEGARP